MVETEVAQGMSLPVALTLLRRAQREVDRCLRQSESHNGSPRRSLPNNFPWYLELGTLDGETFYLLWEEDRDCSECNSGPHRRADSPTDWDEAAMAWKQEWFNPDGGWSRRRVVAACWRGSCMEVYVQLECGHEKYLGTYNRLAAPNSRAGDTIHVQEIVACEACKKLGVGYWEEADLDGEPVPSVS